MKKNGKCSFALNSTPFSQAPCLAKPKVYRGNLLFFSYQTISSSSEMKGKIASLVNVVRFDEFLPCTLLLSIIVPNYPLLSPIFLYCHLFFLIVPDSPLLSHIILNCPLLFSILPYCPQFTLVVFNSPLLTLLLP